VVAAAPVLAPVQASPTPHTQLPGAMGLLISHLAQREVPTASTSSSRSSRSQAAPCGNHQGPAVNDLAAHNAALAAASTVPVATAAAARGEGTQPNARHVASGGHGSKDVMQAMSSQAVPGGNSSSNSSPASSEQYKRAATRHKQCIVCFERKPGVVLLPCQHFLLCGPCWEAVAAAQGPGSRECPYCRSAVEQHMVVFR
jgi:hypothetical protein